MTIALDNETNTDITLLEKPRSFKRIWYFSIAAAAAIMMIAGLYSLNIQSCTPEAGANCVTVDSAELPVSTAADNNTDDLGKSRR
jgi:hypothetical protein